MYYLRGRTVPDMNYEQQHEEDLQRIRGFRLIDDDFMNACFDNNIEDTELILRIILNRPDISVKSVRTQQVMKNLLGRDIWLDIDAKDKDDNEFDVEIQRSDKGADRKRARYHSSMLDAHSLRPKEDFSALRDNYVIFITENDVIGKGKPLYRIERRIEETGELFNDGEHIIYVNGADRDSSTALGRLMHDFFCTDPDDMNYQQLAKKARFFKENEEGKAAMCKVLEDMRNETAREAAELKSIEIAKRLIAQGKLSLEDIADAADLPVEKVRELSEQRSA
jgi:hypothetical protein